MLAEYSEKYRLLGIKISYYRRKSGMNQETFAEKIGKTLNFVSKIEAPNIVCSISLDTLFKIADVLDIPPSKLLEDD